MTRAERVPGAGRGRSSSGDRPRTRWARSLGAGPRRRPRQRGGRQGSGRSDEARDGARGLQVRMTDLVGPSTPRPPEKLRHGTGRSRATPRRRAERGYRTMPGLRESSPWHRPCRRLSLPSAPEEAVPEIRPFRALRFVGDSVGDLTDVVAPPYDVLSGDDRARLVARHPRNVVRLDAPAEEAGDEPDDRYRRAARTLAAWRSDGTLHKDPRTAVYVYEQAYRVPGTDLERTQRGFFGRLRLEPLVAGSGVLPHERTLAAPREDRYRLLRATGVNTSPVVGLYADDSGRAAAILARLAAGRPTVEVCDDDDVRHRLWVVEAEGPNAAEVAELIAIAAGGPITIADGHHRYETALRYRDERRMSRSCEEDPAFDYILTLFIDAEAEPLTVLPTHRIVRGLGD